MTFWLIVIAIALLGACVSINVETPCADSEINVKFPHVGVRSCSTSHDPIPPQPKEVPQWKQQ